MARAKRHYLPGYVWHITHRCHKGEFLLRYSIDRQRWLYWLYQARKRFGLTVLDYMVTSNHVHLLVSDDTDPTVIPDSIQLVAGRTAWEYNRRKNRKGAYWEDRYHATAVESGLHLARCIAYIDTNMVRAGIVDHPLAWDSCGYREIQSPRRKNVLINRPRLRELTGIASEESLQKEHAAWVAHRLAQSDQSRENRWTGSIAVGSRAFAEGVRTRLGCPVKGRKVIGDDQEGYHLRENTSGYNAIFGAKKDDIGPENSHPWNANP